MPVPFDPKLPAHLTDLLAERGSVRKLSRNTIVVHEGEPGELFYVVLSGRVRAFVSDQEGRRTTLEELYEGEYFGEMSIDGRPRAASILTLCETHLLSVPRRDFLEILAERPEFAKHLLMRFAVRVRRLTEQVKSLALMDVQERVVSLLRSLAESEKDAETAAHERLTQQAIAERVGASRSMINRVLKSMLQEGRLRMQGDAILLTKGPPPGSAVSGPESRVRTAPSRQPRVIPRARTDGPPPGPSAATPPRS